MRLSTDVLVTFCPLDGWEFAQPATRPRSQRRTRYRQHAMTTHRDLTTREASMLADQCLALETRRVRLRRRVHIGEAA